MKPNKHRDRLQSASIARGRMFLKDSLYWLPGFPVSQTQGTVEWMCMPHQIEKKPPKISLDREHIRRATYNWNKMVYRFPRALPYLVDDRDRWVEGMPILLKWLKDAIHRGQPLPASPLEVEKSFSRRTLELAASLQSHYPELKPLVDALGWINYLNPRELTKSLAWIEANASSVKIIMDIQTGTEGLVLALNICDIARNDGKRRFALLTQYLGNSRAYSLRTGDAGQYIENWQNKLKRFAKGNKKIKKLPEPPEPHFMPAILKFTRWLVYQDQDVWRKALDLLALMLPDDILPRWQNWWDRVDALLLQAQHLIAIKKRNNKSSRKAKSISRRLENLKAKTPVDPHIEELLENVKRAAISEIAGFYRQLFSTLKRLPCTDESKLVRAAFLDYWAFKSKQYPGHINQFLKEFRSFVVRFGDWPTIFQVWKGVIEDWNRSGAHNYGDFTSELLSKLEYRPLFAMIFEAIAECAATVEKPLTESDGVDICKLVVTTRNPEQASAYFGQLVNAGLNREDLDQELITCAHLLNKDHDNFAGLLMSLYKSEQDYDGLGETIIRVASHLAKAGWPELARDAVLDKQIKILTWIDQKLTVLKILGVDAAPPPKRVPGDVPVWSSRYPETFAGILALLQALMPEAEPTAGRILGKHFPDRKKLLNEIASIERIVSEKPENTNLKQRLENLKNRLSSVKPISQQRIDRLKEKLSRAVGQAVLQTWQDDLDKELRARLAQLLSVQQIPEWILNHQHLEVFAGLLELSRSTRKLGIRLLRKRFGPKPWHLVEEPANQVFLEQLRSKGINMEPWINPPPPKKMIAKNGKKFHLIFEEDPLEIFYMGGYFQTCLSPADCNFFSVVANAADINKHVVFARDERGQVIGRCLIALGTEGEMLTFYPYSLQKDLEFAKIVGELAEDLAGRMGTFVAKEGNIPCLVASEWYDDGPRDLCNRFAFLNEDSDFRQSLESIAPEALIPELKKLFQPLPLNSLTLPLIIEIPEIRKRPELVLPLLPEIEACQNLPENTLIQAAELAYLADVASFSRRVLRSRAVPYLLKRFPNSGSLDLSVMDLLIELEPVLALQVLRRTRSKGIRRDEDETDWERRNFLARAHESLGRTARAQKLRI